MIGRSGAQFILPDDLDGTRREMKLGRSGQHKRNFETRYIHKNGHVVPLVWSGVWCEPEQRYFFFGRDMSERKAAEEQLRRLALYDQLTFPIGRAYGKISKNYLRSEQALHSGRYPLRCSILMGSRMSTTRLVTP
jgi:hypothetical protein